MASVRKRNDKWQVQVRRAGHRPLSETFLCVRTPWNGHEMPKGRPIGGGLPKDAKELRQVTLGDLLCRYRDTVSIHKAGYDNECIVFNALLKHPICEKTLADLRTEDFAEYRNERLKVVKSTTLKR